MNKVGETINIRKPARYEVKESMLFSQRDAELSIEDFQEAYLKPAVEATIKTQQRRYDEMLCNSIIADESLKQLRENILFHEGAFYGMVPKVKPSKWKKLKNRISRKIEWLKYVYNYAKDNY